MSHRPIPVPPKSWLRPYLGALGLAAMGCFASLSFWDVNPWFKVYGLSMALQGSFALVYLVYWLRRSRRSAPASNTPQDPFRP